MDKTDADNQYSGKEMELGSMRQSQQRKVIHFSSGETLEEDDSEEETAEQPHRDPLNKDNLSWRRYACFHLPTACDFVGGKLAGFLGLTRAKYQYAIDEYQRVQKVRHIRIYWYVLTTTAVTFLSSPFSPFPSVI
uniref:Family with sequence similarity 177 member B n=1 Tax=Pygocentrus nattereri TaxID=42514 RepID=A0AAR2M481_PYGNA